MTRTLDDALSTRLDNDDDDHVDSTPLQADGPGSAIVPRTVLQSPTTLRPALMPLDFHASRWPRFRFVPATERLSPDVAHDGDLVVGRRSLAPV